MTDPCQGSDGSSILPIRTNENGSLGPFSFVRISKVPAHLAWENRKGSPIFSGIRFFRKQIPENGKPVLTV